MEENTLAFLEKVVPLIIAILAVTFLAYHEINLGQTNIVSILTGLIGILAGIKIPEKSISEITDKMIGLKKP